MFTITVVAAVVIINKSDLAPILEEFTRSPPVITRAVTRPEAISLPGVRPHLFLYVKGRRGSVRTFPSAHDLPACFCSHRTAHQGRGFGEGFAQHRPRGTWTGRPGSREPHTPSLLRRRSWGARGAVVQSPWAWQSGTRGVHSPPSGSKVTNPTRGVLYFPGISSL